MLPDTSGGRRTRSRRFRALVFVLRVGLSAGLVAIILPYIDWAEATRVLGAADPELLVAGVMALALQPPLAAYRWLLVLSGFAERVGFISLLKWTYVGVLIGQILPTCIGSDAVRVAYACQAGCALRAAFLSVVLDRILMLLGLVALVLLFAPWFLAVEGHLDDFAVILVTLCGIAVTCIAVLLADRLFAPFRRFALVEKGLSMARDLRTVLGAPTRAAALTVLTVASHINLVVAIYLFALAFGSEAGFTAILVIGPLVILASTLPISIGGWGTREVAMVSMFALLGISSEIALLTSVCLGLASIVVVLPGAFFVVPDSLRVDRRNGASLTGAVQTGSGDRPHD